MHWIYWIYSKQEGVDRCYVGKTLDFEQRKRKHKYSCNTDTDIAYNTTIYKYIREHGGWNAFCMETLEICEDNEASARELYWINDKQANLNKQIPMRTKKEWTEQNYEKIKIQNKNYREQNPEKLNRKITCECGCISTSKHISRHRKTQKHKENMLKLLEDKS